MKRLAKPVVALIASCSACAASADTGISVASTIYANEAWRETLAVSDDAWHFGAGALLANMPEYPGSGDRRTALVPLVGATNGRFFIGTNPDAGAVLSAGAYLLRDSRWRLGIALTYDFLEPREESDSPLLQGLGDIERTGHAEFFAVYSLGWAEIRGAVQSDIGGKDQGAFATLDFMARYHPTPELTLTAGPGLTWGNSQYNQTFFGIDNEQSARSGRPGYELGNGLNEIRFSVGANYRFAPRWSLALNVGMGRLHGDAGDSPIVEKKTQTSYAALLAYLF